MMNDESGMSESTVMKKKQYTASIKMLARFIMSPCSSSPQDFKLHADRRNLPIASPISSTVSTEAQGDQIDRKYLSVNRCDKSRQIPT
jgi:hypothetical protein